MKIEYHILGIRVAIVTDCEILLRRLRHLKVSAKQDTPFSGDILIEVLKRNGRYVIEEAGETLISSVDPEWVTLYVNELINFRLAHHLKGFVRIHAACGSLNGSRFLLVGGKGAGKTTLITRLLFEGMDVEGDERVLLRGREHIALPRKFHLKEGLFGLIPQLDAIRKGLTSYPTSYGGRFCFFDPLDAACPWQIRWGETNTLFYLEPNHGSKTEVEACPGWRMAQELTTQSVDFDTNPEPQMSELCRMVTESNKFVMRLGDLDSAVRFIKERLC